MSEHDPDELADELEREAKRLEDRSGEVEQQLDDARQDWRRKRADENVPGAPPPDDEDDHDES